MLRELCTVGWVVLLCCSVSGADIAMFRLLVACLVATQLVPSRCSSPADLPEDEEDEAMFQMRSDFEEFKVAYNRSYDGEEEENRRFQIFVENMKKAEQMEDDDRGTAEHGVTKFSDMTDEEFEQFYLNPLTMNDTSWIQEMAKVPVAEPIAECRIRRRIDWRSYGAVTSVKNQDQCGACWAFATIANVESMWFLKTKRLISMSEQELLDCDHFDRACKGGYPYNAFRSIMQLGGMMSERTYPYRAAQHHCRFRRSLVVARVLTYKRIRPNECEMKRWVAKRGPIIVMMNARALKGYRRGILRPNWFWCPPITLNHVLLVVGYGVERGLPYWIIKNSWGRNWGENGYFRIYWGEKACGLNRFPMTAIV
ncbi:cathepsin L-like isoform X2 [Mobula hypostoma]|uniref:cathepsin L-like isoform X2 n=1 Tax=Mobula hypostoma TaxID=723540 RepID=UPI002FC2A467